MRTDVIRASPSQISDPQVNPRQEWHFYPQIGDDFTHNVVPDTGSTASVMSLDIAKKHGLELEDGSNRDLRGPSNEEMHVVGVTSVLSVFPNSELGKDVEYIVTDSMFNTILMGCKDCEDCGSVKIVRNIQAHTQSNFDVEASLQRLKSKFSRILRNEILPEPMHGAPMDIHFKKNVTIKPRKILTARQPPVALVTPGKKVMEELIKNNVIQKITVQTDPLEWIHPATFVAKPGQPGGQPKARLVTDLKYFNTQVERQVHPFRPGVDLIKNISPDSRVFAKLDMVHGYFQLALSEQAQKYLAFLMSDGLYWYLRAPQGLIITSDEFCRRTDEIFAGIEGILKLIDDLLVMAPTYEVLFERIEEILRRADENNVTMSLDKLEVGEQVKFSGYNISARGIEPTEERTEAITNFPTPTVKKDVKSFCGLAQTLAGFLPDYAHCAAPLTALLSEKVAFIWLLDHQEAFEKVKKICTSNLVLKIFDPDLDTELVTDASRVGLGFVLQQQDPASKNWHLVQCGSRKLTDCESRWAVCELECLAILFGIIKSRHFLFAMEFTVVTDHNPLRGVFRKNLIDIENPRLRRIREKLSEYIFSLTWIEGKRNHVADALSRYPYWDPDPETAEPEFVDICRAISSCEDSLLKPVLEAADSDSDYQAIIEALTKFESTAALPQNHPARLYNSQWTRMSLDNKLNLILLDGFRIMIPTAMREDILDKLHLAHCGQTLMSKLAKTLYFWNGMNNACNQRVDNCVECRELKASQAKESLISTVADGPMSHVSTDLFEYESRHFIMMADRWSGWVWCERLKNQCSSTVVDILQSWFWDWGYPEHLRSDGGPCYKSSIFEQFCEKNHINHEVSSPEHPESNGHAEANVKKAKRLLKKCHKNWPEFREALLALRNNPMAAVEQSASQMFLCRRQRGKLPLLPGATNLDIENAIRGGNARKAALLKTEEKPGIDLSPLNIGDAVVIQSKKTKKWDTTGHVERINETGRSYYVSTETGTVWRNRRFLRPINVDSHSFSDDEDSSSQISDAPPRRSPRLAANARQAEHSS